MNTDAPYTMILATLRERETDPTIDDTAISSSVIIVDHAEVPELCSMVVNRSTPVLIGFSTYFLEKRDRTIDDS
jgi:hypothetical protein